MGNNKDELISGSELSRRIGISTTYISRKKLELKALKCMRGERYYFRAAAAALGRDPDNIQPSLQTQIQKQHSNTDAIRAAEEYMAKYSKTVDSTEKVSINGGPFVDFPESMDPLGTQRPKTPSEEDESEFRESKDLLAQILDAIKDPKTNKDPVKLNGLKTKASMLSEYHKAKNEEIKHRKQVENLFDRDEVLKILGFLASSLRSTLLNLPNNYAVNLEGRSQKQIKDYVTEDVDKMLEQIQKTGGQFSDVVK